MARELREKLDRGRRRGLAREGVHDDHVEAERGQQVRAFFVRGQDEGFRLRAQHRDGVRFKGEQPGNPARAVRGFGQLADERLVSAVDAVEVADGQVDRGVERRGGEALVDVHHSPAANTFSGHHSSFASWRRIAMTLPSSPSA